MNYTPSHTQTNPHQHTKLTNVCVIHSNNIPKMITLKYTNQVTRVQCALEFWLILIIQRTLTKR